MLTCALALGAGLGLTGCGGGGDEDSGKISHGASKVSGYATLGEFSSGQKSILITPGSRRQDVEIKCTECDDEGLELGHGATITGLATVEFEHRATYINVPFAYVTTGETDVPDSAVLTIQFLDGTSTLQYTPFTDKYWWSREMFMNSGDLLPKSNLLFDLNLVTEARACTADYRAADPVWDGKEGFPYSESSTSTVGTPVKNYGEWVQTFFTGTYRFVSSY